MKELVAKAAAKDQPDAIWFLLTRQTHPQESKPEYERLLLRAGELGSASAQRELGAMYATGDWPGPKDLAEAARWYRRAAEQGNANSQYGLGFMLLLGEGEPKNIAEGLLWLERAGAQGESSAFRLLADCYENGHFDVPADTGKAALWRDRMEDHERLHPNRRYSMEAAVDESSLDFLLDIEGVTGFFGFKNNDHQFSVSYKPELITPAELDEKIRAAGYSFVLDAGPPNSAPEL